MPSTHIEQTIHLKIFRGTVANVINSFYVERRGRNLSKYSIRFYEVELNLFAKWLGQQGVIALEELTAEVIRLYLLDISARRNAGGQHASFRAIRALMLWAWDELDLYTRNPITKVKPPKVGKKILPAAKLDVISAMEEVCEKDTFTGSRDIALMLALLDTGARAFELLAMNLEDLDIVGGVIPIHHGKGDNARTVYLQRKGRKATRAYLKMRSDHCPALWITDEGERLKYDGLRSMLVRRAGQANVPAPSPHMFRRACALNMHRNGASLADISHYLGHASFEITRRYLDIDDSDLSRAHQRTSPVENSDL